MNAKDFFYCFGRTLYHIDMIYDEFAKSCEVAPTLLWILYALGDGEAHTQHDICVDWGLPKSTVNTVITDLRQKGYVSLAPIPGKRREMTILLTDEGKAYADSVLSGLYEKEAEAFASLTDADISVLDTLNKITKLLRNKEASYPSGMYAARLRRSSGNAGRPNTTPSRFGKRHPPRTIANRNPWQHDGSVK